ncbi:MAG: hypothetical protein KUL75_05505 [Sterolibacterium sp.]|nr:hypothetical protein [Sterolibacterium sp.]
MKTPQQFRRLPAWPGRRQMVLIALLSAGLLPSLAAHAGKVTYCCTNAQGHNTCGDILPQACYGRAYRELNERGGLIRQVEAPLNAEQRAQRETEEKRKKQADADALLEQRRNQALLGTYASAQEIDFVRDRALDQINTSSKNLQTKYNEALKRRNELNKQLASHKTGTAPKSLTDSIRANELDLQAQLAATEAKKKEMQQVIERYAEEKRRYLELKQQAEARMTAPANPAN